MSKYFYDVWVLRSSAGGRELCYNNQKKTIYKCKIM